MTKAKRIAVLALQGAFAEHIAMLQQLGAETFEVRNLADWNQPKDGLIIPGGESTAMARIMNDEGLLEPITQAIANGLPTMGTCAGCILLAKNVQEHNGTESHRPRFGTMDITVVRNAYGRQLGSFETIQTINGIGTDIPLTFIRAPYIANVSSNVQVLATVDDRIVAAKQDKQLALTFHPELTTDTRIHQFFLEMVK